jgi:hypothetical protein
MRPSADLFSLPRLKQRAHDALFQLQRKFTCVRGNYFATRRILSNTQPKSRSPGRFAYWCDIVRCAATEALGSLTYGLASGPVNRIVKNAQVCRGDEIDRSVSPGEMGELVVRDPYHLGYWAGPGLVEEAPKAATSAMGLLTRCFRSCFGLLAGTSH